MIGERERANLVVQLARFFYMFIVRCVGGSKAPPVLHSSYRTDFERDRAV